MTREYREGAYLISTDRARLDVGAIHRFLAGSYWAKGIPLEVVRRSVENSLCFGLYAGAEQVGFARVVTDYATFAWLSDVFIAKPHRGRGLSKWLMECVRGHPGLQGIRRWTLVTADAPGLYGKSGFAPLKAPERWMEIYDPDMYLK